ncbi:hypothetical protein GOODEAATRI_001787 [Goodea atripinnis]|uniref:Chromodomain-helicase-DNA-binding protein 6-9 tri-helical domain-containing protein n=1 Tax=Goodea atripinnis TaxID=208336 RepID=A0ABV0MQC9_9TELE
MPFKDDLDDFTNSPLDDKDDAVEGETEGENGQNVPSVGGASGSNERLYWPAASALTARLRRLITAYQRSNRREQLRQEALSRPDGRRRRRREFLPIAMVPETGGGGTWTRREEADFYRVVSTFGVVFDTQRQKFDWTQFRAFARLDKKTDESLEKYYYSFIAMCKRVCRMQVKTETELPDPTLIIDPITEERASRTLYRIELLRRIREQVLPHPLLSERLKLCQPSPDLPEWWECGRHDRDLLLGASKHGVSRTDYHILNDPALGFLDAHQRFTSQRGAGVGIGALGELCKVGMGIAETASAPLLTAAELESAAAAAKMAADAPKEEEEGKDIKLEEEKIEMEVKMETGEGESSNIPCMKTEPLEQKANQGDVDEGKDEEAASPMEVRTEDVLPKVEKADHEAKPESQTTNDQDHDLIKQKSSTSPEYHLGNEKDIHTELPDSSAEAQLVPKTVEKEDGEEKETLESLKSPKSPETEKSPEEEEEERLDEDDKSEKSSQAEVSAGQRNFDEESIASLGMSVRDETRDEFCPDALQDRAYAFSFWPKDRVMINRLDNICEAVLKGKWPVNRRHVFDFPGNLLPGHGSAATAAAVAMVSESPVQRRSLAELTLAGIHTPYSGSEDKTLSPQVHEDALSLTVPRQRRRRRKKIEIEAERAAKRRNLMEMVAQLRESHAAAESQNQAIDLTKVLTGTLCLKTAFSFHFD